MLRYMNIRVALLGGSADMRGFYSPLPIQPIPYVSQMLLKTPEHALYHTLRSFFVSVISRLMIQSVWRRSIGNTFVRAGASTYCYPAHFSPIRALCLWVTLFFWYVPLTRAHLRPAGSLPFRLMKGSSNYFC